MKLLIAHPDDDLRRLVRAEAVAARHAVLEARTGDAALEICRLQRPDVVLVADGLRAPGGAELLDVVKRDIDLFRTAIVVSGAHLEATDVRAALERGAHDVLREPVEPAEVVARLQAAARTKTLQEELGEQSRRLEGLIFGDELTGIFNRRFLLTQLSALVSGARRHERPLSLAILDIDHFKGVNDEFGHAAGDAVLAAVAHLMRERLRAEDWVGRLGGEEFLALLPDVDATGAATVAENLRSAIEHTGVRWAGGVVRVTASVGWATLEDDEAPETLLRRADDALYEAKRTGRNRTRGAATLRRRL